MIRMHDCETKASLCELTEAQLAFLIEHLEEEHDGDQDYYLTAQTIEFLQEKQADADLVALLRSALGERESMEVRWERS